MITPRTKTVTVCNDERHREVRCFALGKGSYNLPVTLGFEVELRNRQESRLTCTNASLGY